MKALKQEFQNGYFDGLPSSTQSMISELLEKHFDVDVWTENKPEYIECRNRDGFIPFDHNKGGLVLNGFTDLRAIWGSGNLPAHKKAAKEIQRQIDYSFECLAKDTFDCFKDLLVSKGLTKKHCTYHTMRDLAEKDSSLDEVAQSIENDEYEYLSGDENTIMFELRFMYHGCENGIHRASVSAAVNTEGPYHRSHIPWAPGIFCEGAKEIGITWRTESGLRTKLEKTLKQVTSEVF